jgi:DnaJ-class molecular chaperone
MDLNISLTEAVEGARVQAPTPGGPVTLTIPAGSNTGKVLRLKGKGVAGQGDQFVRLQVVLPEMADEDLKKFVKKWPKRGYVPPRPSG